VLDSPRARERGSDPVSAARKPGLDLSGAVLEGAYRLVRQIGQGGMGAVYEAVQLRLNKRVAVKIMSYESASDTVALARFHREAEITSKLGHPNLVSVIDFGTAESSEPYLVMEFLDGEDLEQRMRKVERLPIATIVRITRQVASALGAAHAQGVVHRDLKPANIFLLQVPGEPEFVKVLDFGISKVKAVSARLTRAKTVVGTPYYMSPEQALGRVDDTDHRADQWALACIVWEMLSGRRPFEADDATALLYQITHIDPPPLKPYPMGLPPAAESVLRRALSRRFDQRFPSIRTFAHEFEFSALGQSSDLTPAPVPVERFASRSASALGPVRNSTPREAGEVDGMAPDTGGPLGRLDATYEVTAHARSSWFRPAYAIVGAVVLVLLVAGAILLRSPRASPNPLVGPPAAARPAAPIRPLVVPQPDLPLAPESPTPTKATGARSDGYTVVPSQGAPKRKALKARPKRRIFEEL
jgi:eukaryotic-like serine/threonine-protein kinase